MLVLILPAMLIAMRLTNIVGTAIVGILTGVVVGIPIDRWVDSRFAVLTAESPSNKRIEPTASGSIDQ